MTRTLKFLQHTKRVSVAVCVSPVPSLQAASTRSLSAQRNLPAAPETGDTGGPATIPTISKRDEN